jgi:hypothetical protein
MDERWVFTPTCYSLRCQYHLLSAAYQVGLSFLTTHMRRAVAACTSPEVLFRAGTADAVHPGIPAVPADALGLAMESINLGTSAPVPIPSAHDGLSGRSHVPVPSFH